MKGKQILLFALGFLAGYLFLTYGPGMSIKLEAPPLEYFVENMTHGWSFKSLAGAATGLILALLPRTAGKLIRKSSTK